MNKIMNLETLVNLSNGENLEIEVKVGNKTYPTSRDFIELEEGKFIVNVSMPIINYSGTIIKDKEILDNLKALGFEDPNVTTESAINFLRLNKRVFIFVESGFRRTNIFGGGQLVHRGNIIIEEGEQSLALESISRDYNTAMFSTLREALKILCK